MRFLIDTNVLVAGLYEAHPAHERAFPWLMRASSGNDTGLLSAHSLAEAYSVLTRLPSKPSISTLEVYQLVQQTVVSQFEIIELTAEDYLAVLKHIANLGIVSGAVFDALIVYAALKGNADQIVTLNIRDFQRVYPGHSSKMVAP